MADKVEQGVFGMTAIIGVAISTLDLLGFLENIPFLAAKIPTITLLAVGLVIGYLTLERRTKIDNIERLVVDGTEQVIRALQGVNVQYFSDSQAVYEYAVKRIRQAKKSVDDLTWGPAEPEITPASRRAFERYVETISAVCTSNKQLSYREVMSFPPLEHLERAENMMRKNLYSYRLRYYQFRSETLPPLLSFMLIDSEEVILAFYRASVLPSEQEIRLAIKHPEIVKLFQDYYDTVWHKAKVLKEGITIEHAIIQRIKDELRQD